MRRFISIWLAVLAVLAIASGAAAGDTVPPTTEPSPPTDTVPQIPCLPGDDCSSPPPPPPPPPAPPPPAPPPPPPPFAACGDGWDNDGDGLIDYLSDPGCGSETDPDEYDPPAPPPDLNPPLVPSGFSTWESSPTWGYFGTRCKTQIFSQMFDQAGLYDVIRYEGRFRVCYVPGGKIVSWSEVYGNAEWVRPFSGWEWRGNDEGYPYGVRTSTKTVEFRYRGKAALCVFKYGCGPQKHPWVTLTFFSNNTIVRRVGVV
jgi:hypothetical protein